MGNRVHVCMLLVYIFFDTVYGGSVTAQQTTVTGIYGTDVIIEWSVAVAGNESVYFLDVVVLPNVNDSVLAALRPILTQCGEHLFGNRLSATYLNGIYTIALKNITYTDSNTFKLESYFRVGSRIDIKGATVYVIVVAPPSIPPTTTRGKDDGNYNTGVIVGAVVGGTAAVVLISAAAFLRK